MRQRHQQIADGRHRRRDADQSRLVAAKTEVSDEHDHGHVHDVITRLNETRLRTAQSEPALQRPQYSGRVRVSDHPEENDTADVGGE